MWHDHDEVLKVVEDKIASATERLTGTVYVRLLRSAIVFPSRDGDVRRAIGQLGVFGEDRSSVLAEFLLYLFEECMFGI